MSKLKLKNLSKSFKEKNIINDISFDVESGDFMVLVGPSGSGKSTILRLIAGLENPDSGLIEINGKSVTSFPPKDRDIAMVFQNYALYPHMSIYENLAFPLKMRKENNETIKKSVHEVAELLGISKHLMSKPKELSGGERQRVALGRAIIRKPQLFLMDEPLSNLDAKLRTQMRAELLKLHKSLGSTVIYVTHDQIEALTMGNKIAVLNNGSIQHLGKPKDVYDKPNNSFVAGFVGSPPMNFFEFKLIDSQTINMQGKTFKLKSQNLKLNPSSSFKLGIRPEYIKVGEVDKIGEIMFEASVDLIEMLGNEHVVYATSIDFAVNSSVAIKVIGDFDLKQNSKIKLSFDFSNAHIFDSISGDRI